jgi:hypothetical protein
MTAMAPLRSTEDDPYEDFDLLDAEFLSQPPAGERPFEPNQHDVEWKAEGAPPFSASDVDEMLRTWFAEATAEPPRPSPAAAPATPTPAEDLRQAREPSAREGEVALLVPGERPPSPRPFVIRVLAGPMGYGMAVVVGVALGVFVALRYVTRETEPAVAPAAPATAAAAVPSIAQPSASPGPQASRPRAAGTPGTPQVATREGSPGPLDSSEPPPSIEALKARAKGLDQELNRLFLAASTTQDPEEYADLEEEQQRLREERAAVERRLSEAARSAPEPTPSPASSETRAPTGAGVDGVRDEAGWRAEAAERRAHLEMLERKAEEANERAAAALRESIASFLPSDVARLQQERRDATAEGEAIRAELKKAQAEYAAFVERARAAGVSLR